MKYLIAESEGFILMWWNIPEKQWGKNCQEISDEKISMCISKNSMFTDTSKHRQNTTVSEDATPFDK